MQPKMCVVATTLVDVLVPILRKVKRDVSRCAHNLQLRTPSYRLDRYLPYLVIDCFYMYFYCFCRLSCLALINYPDYLAN